MSKGIIPFSHFVNIVSTGVSAAFTFNRLNALVMSSGGGIPEKQISEFLSVESVADAYGIDSPEYKYALAFFGYISKSATKPERLSFYRWSKDGFAASLKGSAIENLNNIQKNGGFKIKIDGVEKEVNVDLSAVTSFSEAAEKITQSLENSAVCVYSTITHGFIISVPEKGEGFSIGYALAPETGEDLADMLMLTETNGAVVIPGLAGETLTEALNNIGLINGNYVTVSSLAPLDPATDFKTASEWTKASNGRYCFIANEADSSLLASEAKYKELFGNDGFIGNFCPDFTMNTLTQAAIASVDFSSLNGALNFNFIEADSFEDMAVGKAEELESLNSQRFNCAYRMGGYGQSQVLYGEGNIFGKNFSDITGYIGNTWLKAQLELAAVNLLISLPLVSLRGSGSSLMLTALQDPITRAKNGGIIAAVGLNNLTSTEKAAIITAAGSSDAVEIIEQNGYYLIPQQVTDEDIAAKRLRFLLIYTRNIPINRVVVQNYVIGG